MVVFVATIDDVDFVPTAKWTIKRLVEAKTGSKEVVKLDEGLVSSVNWRLWVAIDLRL